MRYYEVWVSSNRYHGEKPLTYKSEKSFVVGQAVIVPLQSQLVPAVVTAQIPAPSFDTKEIIRGISPHPLPTQTIGLVNWIRTYYPGPFGQILSLVLPTTLTQNSRNSGAETLKHPAPVAPPELTTQQQRSIRQINGSFPQSVLLHGDTGTGKTRVYTELVAQQLIKSRSAIVLTPEIGLTPQLTRTMSVTFPGQTVTIHSNLTPAARRQVWFRILQSSKPLVLIGPRSALFAPLREVGVIIIDEFHDGAYKQEQAPHYLATRVAAKLAELHHAQLILGSATPSVNEYFLFQQKNLPIVRMTEQAISTIQGEANIEIVDLKKRELFVRSPWLSEALLDALGRSLERNEQSLIFLNRRGTARLIICQLCGWQALCPRCDLSLTYHSDKHLAQCHTCGFTTKAPLHCPECSSNNIIFRHIGTKSLVSELEKLFPKATVRRFDSDNNKTESLEQNYDDIRNGAVDIMVGTQILGKGLDLPRLSLLGVVVADTNLSFPDYTSEERTFQLLSQVIGRVHRGHIAGNAIIQTYQPNNPILQAAIKKDYASFYEQQIAERRMFRFPPFRYVLKLICTRASSRSAQQASQKLADELRSRRDVEVVGPTPAFIEKAHNRYRWQITIKATHRNRLIEVVNSLPGNWSFDIDPTNLL